MDFDAFKYEYPSRRGVIYGARGMVCTSQNLAAEAGLDILKKRRKRCGRCGGCRYMPDSS